MGQKVVPISIRLQNNKNWKSKWILDKLEYANLFHFDLELRKYIKTIFNYKNKTLLNNLIIKKHLDKLLIYIYIQDNTKKRKEILKKKDGIKKNINNFIKENKQKNFNISSSKIFIINVNPKFLNNRFKFFKVLKKIRRIPVKYKLKKIIFILNIILFSKNAEMLSIFLSKNLRRTPKHKKYLSDINKIFKFLIKVIPSFNGYKIQIKGRLNGIERSKKMSIQGGQIPLNTLKHNIKYHFSEFVTRYGICSMKVWLFFN